MPQQFSKPPSLSSNQHCLLKLEIKFKFLALIIRKFCTNRLELIIFIQFGEEQRLVQMEIKSMELWELEDHHQRIWSKILTSKKYRFCWKNSNDEVSQMCCEMSTSISGHSFFVGFVEKDCYCSSTVFLSNLKKFLNKKF